MKRKLAKSAVEYENPARKEPHCAECQHFEKPDACKIVAGRISPKAWCDHYKREGAEKAKADKHAAHLILILGPTKQK